MSAPQGFTQVSSTYLQDATGTVIANATAYWQPVVGSKRSSFRAGGPTGGQVSDLAVQATVTNGAMSLVLADTTLTYPVNAGYDLKVVDNVTDEVLLCYSNVQPSGGAWNLDAYNPNLPAQAPYSPGIQGPAGTITGATATGLSAGSNPTVTVGGTPSAATLAFGIPAGQKGDKGDDGDKGDTGATGSVANAPSLGVVDPYTSGSPLTGSVSASETDIFAHSWEDSKNLVAVGITKLGVLWAKTVRFVSATITTLTTTTLNAISASTTNLTTLNLTVGNVLVKAQTDGPALAIEDAAGFQAFTIGKDGVTHAATMQMKSASAGAAAIGALTVTGSLTLPAPVAKLATIAALKAIPAQDCGVAPYGQSLAIGTNGVPLQSLTQRYNSVGFVGGVVPQIALFPGSTSAQIAACYASYVPLVEIQNTQGGNGGGGGAGSPAACIEYNNNTNYMAETPCGGISETLWELFGSEDNLTTADIDLRFVMFAEGRGGSSAAELAKGTAPYARYILAVQNAYNLSTAAGRKYVHIACPLMQGENDIVSQTTQAAFVSTWTQIMSDLNSDIKAITGQTQDVQFFWYQTFGIAYASGYQTPIDLAQIQMAQTIANCHLATPIYQLQPYAADQVHLPGPQSKQAGGYFGVAIKRVCFDGVAKYKVLEWTGVQAVPVAGGATSKILVAFPLGRTPVLIDTGSQLTADNPAQANAGFWLTDSSGNAVALSGVAVVGQNQIGMTAAANITSGSGYKLFYGGPSTLGGNVRDSDGAYNTVTALGTILPLHNWMRVQEHTF